MKNRNSSAAVANVLFMAFVSFGFALPSVAGPPEPRPGAVVLDLHFDDGESQFSEDASGMENHGILGGSAGEDGRDPLWVTPGKRGGALEFDGKNDVLRVPFHDSLLLRRGLVAEAWVYQTRRSPFARVLDMGAVFDMYIDIRGIPSFRFRGAEAFGVRGPQPVPLNQWVLLNADYEGQTLSLSVNGQKVGSRKIPGMLPAPTGTAMPELRIGNGHAPRPFCGRIDEVRIINKGYRPPESAPFESDKDTVALWHLDRARTGEAGKAKRFGFEVLGARPTPGKFGDALEFDGHSAVRIPWEPALDFSRKLTIEAWIKQTRRSRYARIIEKDNWIYGLWIMEDGRLDFFFHPTKEGYSHTLSNETVPLNRWVQVRAEFDEVEVIIYLDGAEVTRRELADDERKIMKSRGDLFLGNRKDMDRGLIGRIDEVRLSSCVRTPHSVLEGRASPYPSKQIWILRAVTRGLKDAPAAIRISAFAVGNEQPVQEIRISDFHPPIGQAQMDTSKLPVGKYRLKFEALDGRGQVLATRTIDVEKEEKPDWLGAGTGRSTQVLPPWTPVEAEGQGADGVDIRCWNRQYKFQASPFPGEISSSGQQLLAGPTQLVALIGGRSVPLSPWKIQLGQRSPVSAQLEGVLSSAAVQGKAKATVEFDGMMRFDVRVGPAPGAKLDGLFFEVPLKATVARLMHFPGNWFKDPTCAGKVPSEGWQRPDTWYLWTGNEELGLCWFAEDQEAWGLDSKRPGIELHPEGNTVRLRVWLIHSTEAFRRERTFTWGLMATPVKPLPKGWQHWRFGSVNRPVNISVLWPTLSTSKWHSFPVPPNPEAYKRWVSKAHGRHMKFVPYTNFNMQSNTGRDWRQWGQEWDAHAGRGTANDVLAMNLVNVRSCAMTESWTDFITWKYRRFLETFGSDGFYLDNSIPGRCNNPEHPASHRGRVHIFAARELMKRFYTITKSRNPENLMICHISTRVCIPVLSFCDAIVDGEQYGWMLKDDFDGHYMPITPLDRVRAELMAWPLGLVPFYLPCNRGINPWTPDLMREMLALFLPHGMRFWFVGAPATMARVLDAVDAFKLEQATFVPYWSHQEWLRSAEREGLIISAYARESEALLIVSNLRDKERPVRVPTGPATAGFHINRLEVRDVLDGQPVALNAGTLSLTIRPRDLRLIRVVEQ